MTPFLSSIAAVSRDGIIGVDGGLPWDLPEDLNYFRTLTRGHPVLMGRKTFTSIGRALPGRKNFVITRDPEFLLPEGVVRVTDLDAQLGEWAARPLETGAIFAIGGEEIYRRTLPYVKDLYLTEVDIEIGRADAARFPSYREIRAGISLADGVRFVETKREDRPGPPLSFRFLKYERIV